MRTIVLDQSPDRGPARASSASSSTARPIFAKGANWIPCDSFVARDRRERYRRLLAGGGDANMTMLRMWGGGIYEHDHSTTCATELGMLVWQDFMFACAMYPEDDPDFVAEVDAEARYRSAAAQPP